MDGAYSALGGDEKCLKILVENLEGKAPLTTSVYSWQGDTKGIRKEVGRCGLH
jgi:hypothetical protein